MNATYISVNSFKVSGDRTNEFVQKRRIKADCGVNGIVYAVVVSSSYLDPDTTVVIDESELTSNLVTVLYGIVQPGNVGSLPDHDHTTEGTGGLLGFISLVDTPTTYSGAPNKFLKATSSGIEFVDIFIPDIFLDLDDTPISYSGNAGKYIIVKDDESGVEFTSTLSGSGLDIEGNADITGNITADTFYGDGSNLTGITSSFLDLTDTPSSYSGADKQSLVATNSGVVFRQIVYYGTSSPPSPTGLVDGTLFFKYID